MLYKTNVDCFLFKKLCKITPVNDWRPRAYYPRLPLRKYSRPTVSSHLGELFCIMSTPSNQYLYNITMILPIEETTTTPSPMPSIPPMYKNLSLGAHAATQDRPEVVKMKNIKMKIMIMMHINLIHAQHFYFALTVVWQKWDCFITCIINRVI